MSWITYLTLSASAMALLLSTGACIVAVRSWLQSRSRSSSVLLQRLSDVEAGIDHLQLNLGRLRSRMNMQKAREKLPESTEQIDEGRDPADTRAALNDQLARGALRPNR